MSRGFAGLPIVLGLAVFLGACASLGTETNVYTPELVNTIKVVGLAPIYVDDLTFSVCGKADSVALAALVSQIEQSGAFRVVSADTLLAHVQEESVINAGVLLASARRQDLDGVLFCRVEADKVVKTSMETVGFGLDFSTGMPSSYRIQEEVTEVRWGGANVSLQMVESSAEKIVITTTFNTTWGKSYGTAPSPDKQIEDAIEGAFKPLAKEWAK